MPAWPRPNLSQADLTDTTFRQTFGRLETLVASPDGRWLAGGGERGDLRLYPLNESQPIVQLHGHTNTVAAICFSPDATLLISAGHDQTINLWQVETGQIIRTIDVPAPVLSVEFSPDGALLAAGEANGDIRIWHAGRGDLLARIHGHAEAVTQIAFHPHGTLLASCGTDGYLRLWRINSLLQQGDNRSKAKIVDENGPASQHESAHTPVQTIRSADELPFKVLGFNADGRYLAAGTAGGIIMMGETNSEKPWRILGSHTDALLSLAFHPQRMILATSADDAAIRLWDAATFECTDILEDHGQAVWSVAFTPDGTTLASTGADGTIRRWQFTPTGQMMPLRTFFGAVQGIETLAWSRNGRRIATGDLNGMIRLWAVDESIPHCVQVLHDHAAVRSLGFSPDSHWLATTGQDRQNAIRMWDVESGRQAATLLGHTAASESIAYAPNGGLLASGDRTGIIHLWDISQLDHIGLIRFLHGHRSNINALTFNPVDAALLASYGNDQTVRLWNTESGDEVARLPGYGASRAIQFDPTGRYLTFEDQHSSIALWDLAEPSQPTRVVRFEGHIDSPSSLAFHPNGSRLISGSFDRTVRLWDTNTGQMLKIIGRHDGYVTSVAFSPDGQFVASAGKDDVAHIWCVESGERLHTLHTPGPYDGMDITGVTGISEAQRASLKALGAVET